ncbi:hypothetical protein, partial [Nocardia cerradoensis]|uniref:hypothetical protein n=1 Tax=Nocardia cerradoensis TaxID=85688 RepID=UPI001CB8B16A
QLFYAAIKTNWPTSYYAASDLVGAWLSASGWRYVLFRFVPVFMVTLCAMKDLQHSLSARFRVALMIALIHVLLTAARAITAD